MSSTASTANAGLSVLGEVAKYLAGFVGPRDLVSYTRPARVEPITLIDADCMYMDVMPDVMQSTLSLFSAYYLQAWALSVNIGNINVIRHLERLNPNRSAFDEQLGAAMIGLEHFQDRLPVFGDARNAELSMEARDDDDSAVLTTGARDVSRELREVANLSVGKLFNVELSDGDKKAAIPISIRLLANSIPTESLVHILTSGSKENSLRERWQGYKAGRLELIRDLIFCQDLIDQHKKNLIKDKEGFYDAILKRRTGNALASVFGNPSIASASNIFIMSKKAALKTELAVNGPLKNFGVRQKIFEQTYLMLLIVIDPEWNQVTFYTRGIPEATVVNARDLKSAAKGDGPSVTDILAAYRLGNSAPL